MKWTYSLSLNKYKRYIDLSDKKINEIKNLMPEKLNSILIKSRCKIYYVDSQDNILKIVIICENMRKDGDILEYYLILLNKSSENYSK
ncbi:MAG: hypothetical protein ACTSRP_05635 [Candidatus Helarchaeota archaeon]